MIGIFEHPPVLRSGAKHLTISNSNLTYLPLWFDIINSKLVSQRRAPIVTSPPNPLITFSGVPLSLWKPRPVGKTPKSNSDNEHVRKSWNNLKKDFSVAEISLPLLFGLKQLSQNNRPWVGDRQFGEDWVSVHWELQIQYTQRMSVIQNSFSSVFRRLII